MKNIRATLAIVWRIASPYFRSEDKWAARGLLAAVIVETVVVARRATTQRDEVRASLATAFGRMSHQN